VVSALLGGAWLSLPTRSVLVEEAHASGAEDARGTVTWTVADRCILIAGQRGGEAFAEEFA
jgi:hypothetical protein